MAVIFQNIPKSIYDYYEFAIRFNEPMRIASIIAFTSRLEPNTFVISFELVIMMHGILMQSCNTLPKLGTKFVGLRSSSKIIQKFRTKFDIPNMVQDFHSLKSQSTSSFPKCVKQTYNYLCEPGLLNHNKINKSEIAVRVFRQSTFLYDIRI